jgi:hypothetical protein
MQQPRVLQMSKNSTMLEVSSFRLLLRLSIAFCVAAASFQLRGSANAEVAPESNTDAKADYQRKLAEYQAAQQQFEELAQPYWKSVEEKRLLRNAKRRKGESIVVDDYALTQPPKYTGPARPIDPAKPEQIPAARAKVPVVADFLKYALSEFEFAPTVRNRI